MNQLSRILGRAFSERRFYNHRDLEKVESPEPHWNHLSSPRRRFLGRIGEPVAIDDNALNNPFETTNNRGRNTMGLLQRSTVSSRALAVVLGVLLVVSLPAAWPIVAADDQSSLGAGIYPAAYAITGAKIVTAPGKSIDAGTIVVRRGIIEAVGPAKDVRSPTTPRRSTAKAWWSIRDSSTCTQRSDSEPAPSGRRPARAGRSTWPRRL